MKIETGTIKTGDGAQIYFEDHGTGEPVILLHGFTGSSANWAPTIAEWRSRFRLIVPDLRGHGRSGILTTPFRHRDAAGDLLTLLDCLEIPACKAVGISGGGNILLHMATMEPERMSAMVLVSATPWFPEQARTIMRQYKLTVTEQHREALRRTHPAGDDQIDALLDSAESFAASYGDMNLTPPHLGTIRARTLIVQGDRDPLYPVDLSVEMAKAIPQASLWIVPDAGHGPVIGERWNEFLTNGRRISRQIIRREKPHLRAPVDAQRHWWRRSPLKIKPPQRPPACTHFADPQGGGCLYEASSVVRFPDEPHRSDRPNRFQCPG